ncbi:hypothetical protein NPX13_g4594 [Xylaria arbuscula]|uniref:GPI mannosyltransferase 2 n=1 Tax=Xylaria arbuscula TaxID=114810 RepID=A0A9W8NG74_9PEZI|nr:hypothetical protein NPX13_g4594 [Xylaria arbuscula]
MPLIDDAHPLRSLSSIFISWKIFLFAIALGSGVGPAYDTSSTLLLSPEQTTHDESIFDLATRLTRWDAIYYIQASRRGYLFEQEWAFASGLPTIVSFLTNVLVNFGIVGRHEILESTIAIFVANASHLLSALVLYKLGLAVWKNSRISLVAAVLHVLSPGGLFLSAPYSESSYALLSFTGYLFFAKATLGEKRTLAHGLGSELRPWCTRRLPSIYTFVQEHYWNVGFLRYWTPGNIPLFLLAGPMLYLLGKSGTAILFNPYLLTQETKSTSTSNSLATFIQSLALAQVILTILAVTNYHIQIITRISSGYPLWYWWLANLLSDKKTAGTGKKFVMFMVMYAGIQGALFASFLPPA